MNKPTFIDLFCGCGGFSLGMEKAGFQCLSAIDFNAEAVAAYKANFKNGTLTLQKDLSSFGPVELAAKLGVNAVDVIVGGPPCQGFSNVRQNKAANSGSRVRRDGRRYLFRCFLDYVAAFRPKIFVMENVLGIQSTAKGKFFTMVQAEARKHGYRVQAQVEESWKLGVPQKRRRQLFIGVRDDIPGYFPSELKPCKRATHYTDPTLGDAIGDLPPLEAGMGEEKVEYNLDCRREHYKVRGPSAQYFVDTILEVARATQLTAHRARPHNEQDLRDFARILEGEHSGEAEARGVKLEFTYKRTCFEDRYRRQHRDRLCSTIVAHLSKDGLGFIHPEQNRSLTPREAARIQTFPDWFQFPISRTHQFRVIGNAVPPLVAEAVGEELMAFLLRAELGCNTNTVDGHDIPTTEAQAVEWLRPLLDVAPQTLRNIPLSEFKRAWFAIAFLYNGLHPASALDHGDTIARQAAEECAWFTQMEPRLFAPYYERSGWPVVLAPIAREAWLKFRRAELNESEFYCCEAQKAGLRCIERPRREPVFRNVNPIHLNRTSSRNPSLGDASMN